MLCRWQEGKIGRSSSAEKRGFALSKQSELWVSRAEQNKLGAGDPGEACLSGPPSWTKCK